MMTLATTGLRPGDLLLHYPGENCSADYTEPTVSAVLQIPAERCARQFQHIQAGCNRLVPVTAPGAAILSAALRAAAESTRQGLPEPQLGPLANALLELTDRVFPGDAPATAGARPGHSLSRRAIAYVEQSLSSPELSVRSIAVSLGVSLRTVHEIFRRQCGEHTGFVRDRDRRPSAALDKTAADLPNRVPGG
ncbi:MAG: transposase family protein [Gammaproteobacteria bacterium]|nr:transposase family protein [Gammaproteobacteria bacterium]